MRKRLSIVILVLFFGLSQSVQGVHLHFCSTQLVGFDFVFIQNDDHAGCGKCIQKSSCCKDVVQVFEHADFDHTVSTVLIKPAQAAIALEIPFYYTILLHQNIDKEQRVFYSDVLVSDDVLPRYILHRQFRL